MEFGLNGANSVTLSGDGNYAYVTGYIMTLKLV